MMSLLGVLYKSRDRLKSLFVKRILLLHFPFWWYIMNYPLPFLLNSNLNSVLFGP